MKRIALGLSLALCLAPAALAQNGINWITNFEKAVAESKRTRKPLMLYVHGYADQYRSRSYDIENDQRLALLNPIVLLYSRYYIPFQGDLSAKRDLLQHWGMSDKTELEIVFVTPEGDKIDNISSAGVAQASSLAQKMAACFTKYRNELYRREYQKALEKDPLVASEFKSALQMITDFNIMIADEALIQIVKRPKVPEAIQAQVLDTLAQLSSPLASKYLMEAAPTDPKVAATLAKCTPAVAEQLIAWIEDGADQKKQYLGYTTAAKIVRLSGVKNEAWWGKANPKIKGDEIKRACDQIRRVAQQWKERYGDFR